MAAQRPTRRCVAVFALGAAAALVAGCNALNAEATPDYGKTPVLFVHGRGLGAYSFATMMKRLRARGYPASFLRAIDLVPKDGPNARAAEEQIAPFVERLLADANEELARSGREVPRKTKIDIVAHSMGSVSSRWYAAKLQPQRVRTWISIAGPNHGSRRDCPGSPGSGKEELCPMFARTPAESYVQFHLNGPPGSDRDETPYGTGIDAPSRKRVPPDEHRRILYITLSTPTDEFVPNESTVLDGAGAPGLKLSRSLPVRELSPGNYITVRAVSHDWLVETDYVIDFVHEVLNRRPD